VYDGHNDDGNDNGPNEAPDDATDNEAPGITMEHSDDGMTPEVTAEDGVNPGVAAKDGITPGVIPDGITGVIADHGTTGVPTEHEAEEAETKDAVAPDVITSATDINERSADTDSADDNLPPPFGPPRSEEDSDDDSDDEGDGDDSNEVPENEVYHPDSMTPSIQRLHGLRPRKPRDYRHMHSHATVMHYAMM
jgi:hypothetical protein